MNAAHQLHALGQSLWLDNITRALHISEFAVTGLTSNPTIFDQAIKSAGVYDDALDVSPLLADDTAGTIKAAARLSARAQRPNLFIKIPGTRAGLPAIEESIFAGVPINVTLLFSCEQYIAAAEAYMRGIERRIAAGLDPKVVSVASIFVSRWDVAVKDRGSRRASQPSWHRHRDARV